MEKNVRVAASGLLRGALDVRTDAQGWSRPCRFAPEQVHALGSCRAWHPGLFRQMAACTAGVCLDFITDSAHVSLEIDVDPMPSGSRAVIADVQRWPGAPRPPYDGVSVQVGEKHLGLRVPNGAQAEVYALAARPGGVRRVRAWLPCLTGCRVREVAGDGTFIEPAPDDAGALLVLGDSIAQGFVCCDPAYSWPALLARETGLTLINQGVGGQVFQPGSLVGVAPACEPALIVVEFGANYRFEPCQASRVENDVRTYLYQVGTAWADVPTAVITPTFHREEPYPTHPKSCFADVERMICEQAARYPQMRVVDGSRVLPPDPTLLADGSDHPSPEGQMVYFQKLTEQLVCDVAEDAGKLPG